MAVAGSDLTWWRSAIGDTAGGAITATPVTDAVNNNVWPTYTDAERIAGATKYRKTFVQNDHASDSAVLPVIWVADQPDNMTENIGLGFDDADDDDAVTCGNLVAWSAGAVVSLQSDGADTRTCRIYGIVGGVPTMEVVVLTGTTPVLSVATFTTVYAVRAMTASGTRTITVKQGSGGTTRGTIGTTAVNVFLWLAASAKATGLKLPNLGAGESYGVWDRLVVAPAAGAVPENLSILAAAEA